MLGAHCVSLFGMCAVCGDCMGFILGILIFLPFYFVSLARRLSMLVRLFKEPLLFSLIFFLTIFLLSILLNSVSSHSFLFVLMFAFLSIFFFKVLGVGAGLFVLDFSSFLIQTFSATHFPLGIGLNGVPQVLLWYIFVFLLFSVCFKFLLRFFF